MTDTNQKLREAFESRMTDNGKWPNAIKQGRNGCYLLAQTENAWTEWQACAEALALPTADHLPDAGEMVVDHFPDATKMIETAAPVGELPELPEPFALSVSVHDGEHCKWPLVECMLYQKHPNEKQNLYTADQMRAYARAALSAGDAGWQPIETAPMDGRLGLVYRPLAANTRDEPIAIKSLIGGDRFCWPNTAPKGSAPTNPTDGACHVTHWMPLPPAPAMRKDKP